MRRAAYSTQFKRDLKMLRRRRKDLEKLKLLMAILLAEKPLPMAYRDHSLKGRWRNFRDAHIEPDWLLIYKLEDDLVRFERTGRHSDLFKE